VSESGLSQVKYRKPVYLSDAIARCIDEQRAPLDCVDDLTLHPIQPAIALPNRLDNIFDVDMIRVAPPGPVICLHQQVVQ
jgi:hypothetical protein